MTCVAVTVVTVTVTVTVSVMMIWSAYMREVFVYKARKVMMAKKRRYAVNVVDEYWGLAGLLSQKHGDDEASFACWTRPCNGA
jgi:hypothetical protein